MSQSMIRIASKAVLAPSGWMMAGSVTRSIATCDAPVCTENLSELIVLRRKLRGRVRLANSDRWFFVQLYRWFPSILQVLAIIRPETLIRWHRSGFRC